MYYNFPLPYLIYTILMRIIPRRIDIRKIKMPEDIEICDIKTLIEMAEESINKEIK